MAAPLFEMRDFPRRSLFAPVFLPGSSARASPRRADQLKTWDSYTPEGPAHRLGRKLRCKETAKRQSKKTATEAESGISGGSLLKFQRNRVAHGTLRAVDVNGKEFRIIFIRTGESFG
jgi:hypothetical protein